MELRVGRNQPCSFSEICISFSSLDMINLIVFSEFTILVIDWKKEKGEKCLLEEIINFQRMERNEILSTAEFLIHI